MKIVAGVVICLVGCANNVPQDRSTGPDGKHKGARELALENGEGKASGIVTYPGGDRVDWRKIVLPEGKRGTLDVQLSYTTPRPGLKVSFELFDQWNHPVKAEMRGRGRLRSASVAEAKGTYFIRVFAPGRGDAGQYRLKAAFAEERIPEGWGAIVLKMQIPDPPRLADIPPIEEPVVAQPPPPTPPKPPEEESGAKPPPPPPPAKPVVGRVLKAVVGPDGIDVTIAVGSSQGVTDTWGARSLRGETSSPLSGGTGKILRINKTTTIVRLPLTKDVVDANPRVELTP